MLGDHENGCLNETSQIHRYQMFYRNFIFNDSITLCIFIHFFNRRVLAFSAHSDNDICGGVCTLSSGAFSSSPALLVDELCRLIAETSSNWPLLSTLLMKDCWHGLPSTAPLGFLTQKFHTHFFFCDVHCPPHPFYVVCCLTVFCEARSRSEQLCLPSPPL